MGSVPTFGELLRHHRRRRGLTQAELASVLDVSGNYVAMLEGGRRQRPSRDLVDASAKALDLSQRDHGALLGAAGFGLIGEAVTANPTRHPAHSALESFLSLPEGSRKRPEALREVVQELLGASAVRGLSSLDKSVLRVGELIGLGYFHSTGEQPRRHTKAESTYRRRRRQLEESVYSLAALLADTTVPLEKRIAVTNELISLARWKLENEQGGSGTVK